MYASICCLITLARDIKACGGVQLYRHSFLIPALEGGDWLASRAWERAFRYGICIWVEGGGGALVEGK